MKSFLLLVALVACDQATEPEPEPFAGHPLVGSWKAYEFQLGEIVLSFQREYIITFRPDGSYFDTDGDEGSWDERESGILTTRGNEGRQESDYQLHGNTLVRTFTAAELRRLGIDADESGKFFLTRLELGPLN